MERKVQTTLDIFLNMKSKRKHVFYVDWNITPPSPQWWCTKPKQTTWSTVIKWKQFGDIVVCCTDQTLDSIERESQSKLQHITNKINTNTKEYSPRLISFLKSHLQKCTRRQETSKALVTALLLLIINKNEFLRRFSIIILEDVRVLPFYPVFIWWVSACSKGYSLSPEQVKWIISFVNTTCEEDKSEEIFYDKTRDSIRTCTAITEDKLNIPKFLDIVEGHETWTNESKNMLYSIAFRMTYGGMSWDMGWLTAVLVEWLERFLKHKSVDPGVNEGKTSDVDIGTWLETKVDNAFFIPEGVDFHCFPGLIKEIQRDCWCKHSEDDLKNCVWEYSSKINTRKDNSVEDKSWERVWEDIKTTLKKNQNRILAEMVGEVVNNNLLE